MSVPEGQEKINTLMSEHIITLPLILLLVFSILIISCADEVDKHPIKTKIIDLSNGMTGANFSLQKVGSNLHILYPDLESLSLKMLTFSGEIEKPFEPEETYYLDRIGYSPEVDYTFGEHLYLVEDNRQHIFYFDLEGEEKKVLKWINKTFSEKTWWIDIVPASGKLVAALSVDPDRIDLFLNLEEALVVEPAFRYSPVRETEKDADPSVRSVLPAKIPRTIRPLLPAGDVSIISGNKLKGFTVYDTLSHRLYLIKQDAGRYLSEALFDFGEIHYSALTSGENLDILVYDSASSELIFLEKELSGEQPRQTPVTLSRGTRSVYFFLLSEQRYFVFDEIALDKNRKKTYRISLLYMADEGYVKTFLLESSNPIRKFKAVYQKQKLYLVFLQETLKFMVADLGGIISIQNHDL